MLSASKSTGANTRVSVGNLKPDVQLLIIEDDPFLQRFLSQAFHKWNGKVKWKPIIAETGKEGLDRVYQRDRHVNELLPQLILLDWNLPGISGLDVLKRLKGDLRLSSIPILIFSSSEDPEDREIAERHHANGFLYKPMDLGLLGRIIENIEQFWLENVKQLPSRKAGRKPAA